MHKYRQLEKAAAERGEHNDCAVKALALATGHCYNVAQVALQLEGRKDKCGTYPAQTWAATEALGFKTREVWNAWESERGMTVRTVGQQFPKGTFYVHVAGHILTMRDGEVEDWTRGSRRKVKRVVEVTKQEAK